MLTVNNENENIFTTITVFRALENGHTTNSVVHFHRIGFFATKLKLVGQFAYNIHNRPFSLNEKNKNNINNSCLAKRFWSAIVRWLTHSCLAHFVCVSIFKWIPNQWNLIFKSSSGSLWSYLLCGAIKCIIQIGINETQLFSNDLRLAYAKWKFRCIKMGCMF